MLPAGQKAYRAGGHLARLQPEGGFQKQGSLRMPVGTNLPLDAVWARQGTHMDQSFRHQGLPLFKDLKHSPLLQLG